jgi:hypothetical protein
MKLMNFHVVYALKRHYFYQVDLIFLIYKKSSVGGRNKNKKIFFLIFSACQETGAIAPAPVSARKFFLRAWSIAPVKKKKKFLIF